MMRNPQRGRQLVRLDRDIVIPAGTVLRTEPGPGPHVRVMVEVDPADVTEHDASS